MTRQAPPLRDGLLVALTFGSGAVDALSFLGLGRVFTANMTGNFVLLGLAAGQGAGADILRSGVSLLAFSAGVLAASRWARRGDREAVWPVEVTWLLGLEALIQAALLAGWLAVSGHPGTVLEAVLVGVSALAMGIQSGAVASLGVRGVSTTYVTGTLTGLLRGGESADLRRRALVVVALLAGAAGGAVLFTQARDAAPALPLATTLGVTAVALFAARR